MPLHARAKIGRNDPCPCGSGRKYKHCCIPSRTPSIDTIWARQHEDYARLTREMTRFAERKFEKQIYDAWQDFNLSDIPELLEQSSDELQVFMPYFLFQWDPDRPPRSKTAHRRGGVVARWYMLEKSKQLTAMERLFLDQAATQPMSFYEVLWSVPGDRVAVRDVLIGGVAEVIELRKKLRKKIAKQNRNLNADDLLRYSATIRAVYLDIRDALHAPLRLANTDGDPLIFHTLTFRIESADAAFEALAPLAVGRSREELLDDAERDESGKLRSVDFDWIREGDRKFKSWDNTILGHIKISAKRLIAEVNSENRAKRLRNEIEKRLGSIGVHQSTVAQTLEQLRKNTPQDSEEAELHEAEVEALLADPEARKFLQATTQKQTESWVHEKIPALGGRTPIEAVRDPDGKEAVEALLAHWERHDENDVSPNLIRPDISAIRRLLNLAHPVS